MDPSFSLSNGALLARRFYNRTFSFNFTTVNMDNQGARTTSVVLQDLNMTTGELQVCGVIL